MVVAGLLAAHGGDPDVDLVCYEEGDMAAKAVPQDDVITMFYTAKFCLTLAGDASSSRRVVEAIVYGCVPVFIGPPFHAEVVPDLVDFATFGITFSLPRDALQTLADADPAQLDTRRFW